MMESREREKYLVDKSDIASVIKEALALDARERHGSGEPHRQSRLAVTEILAAEVVRLRAWGMWTLSPEDIEHVAHDMGLTLTSAQLREARRLFKKAFQHNIIEILNGNWPQMVKDAIEEVLGRC